MFGRRLLICAWMLLTPRPVAAIQQPGASDSVGAELVVRVLDVGQGDAIYIENGSSRVLIDGGPSTAALGRYLDSLGLNDSTIDVVVLSHAHLDHYSGLRELFRTSRNISVRYFFENKDLSAAVTLSRLRDSVLARMDRGNLVYRDTDDPCSNGVRICTITMAGGAKLHIMAPMPGAASANNRSAAVKLVGPDSASFTMWLAGDAEYAALRWFEQAGYSSNPGMVVSVLKADHHGSCNGVTSRYLALTHPAWVVASLGASNGYGHVHTQAKRVYRQAQVPWYRTDRNGTVTIRAPGVRGGGFTITPEQQGISLSGGSDRRSKQAGCNP
ncbi:MAG: MBL fold metallo-hydrolase [Gemmatimonadaceae bacterium]